VVHNDSDQPTMYFHRRTSTSPAGRVTPPRVTAAYALFNRINSQQPPAAEWRIVYTSTCQVRSVEKQTTRIRERRLFAQEISETTNSHKLARYMSTGRHR